MIQLANMLDGERVQGALELRLNIYNNLLRSLMPLPHLNWRLAFSIEFFSVKLAMHSHLLSQSRFGSLNQPPSFQHPRASPRRSLAGWRPRFLVSRGSNLFARKERNLFIIAEQTLSKCSSKHPSFRSSPRRSSGSKPDSDFHALRRIYISSRVQRGPHQLCNRCFRNLRIYFDYAHGTQYQEACWDGNAIDGLGHDFDGWFWDAWWKWKWKELWEKRGMFLAKLRRGD